MKKTIFLLAYLLISLTGFSQSYEGFNYKALLTDNGTPVANQNIDVKVSIYEHHTLPSPATILIWQEEHTAVLTDANGIFSIEMGAGNRLGGTAAQFSDIDWSTFMLSNMNYSIDVKWGGNAYQNLVDHEIFKAVPLAKIASKANELNKQYGQIVFDDNASGLKFEASSGGSNRYEIKLDGTHLGFFYNNVAAMDIIGSGLVNINDKINVNGKLIAPDSGDSDMKAYIYGKVYSDGSTPSSPTPNSDGFSVQKTGTGVYKITFNHSPGAFNKYLVVPSIYGPYSGMVRVNAFNSYFNVYTSDASGNAANRDFTFVVFKK